jgi:hypothetical protein
VNSVFKIMLLTLVFVGIITSPHIPGAAERLKKREKKFENRVYLMENLEKEKANKSKNEGWTPAPPFTRDGETESPNLSEKPKKIRKYRRCTDDAMPEEEVVLRGQYRLNPQQAQIYQDFAMMIAQFDHYDAVCLS